ncbi:inhibitor of vertebrate lysozyme family protein [Pseudomonas fluorescens]|uniref:inhibitor of vertebrate lysozyme family protein n=1 Tax=Pseudomonas fluorescens TaxID=294 RepID=UPI0007D09657|nr:inhibitor of vertebrate lysozyme family protein [Pseudomonas fluorescens]
MSALKTLAAALLLGGSAMAMAANDGQTRVNELLSSDPQYRQTWEGVVKKEERLPEWVMNLSGTPDQQMNAVTEDGDKYLVGPLCETADKCLNHRLIVAFSFDKKDAYAMLVDVPEGLPADKSPTRHATYRFLGKPNQGMQDLLMETLKKDPNWY